MRDFIVDDDPHHPELNADTKYGFIYNGTHFERMHEEGGETLVYVSSRAESKFVRVSREGEITLESAE